MAERPLVAQDWANISLGLLCLVGTFAVGKIAVNSIIEARKEHFDRRGQPPVAIKARESTIDGLVKVAATGFSIYQIFEQLPKVLSDLGVK